MKKYRFLLICLSLFYIIHALPASPDDGDNFYVYTKGTAKAIVYSLDNIDKLTFDDMSMRVWTNAGKTDYAYGDISLLTFCEGVRPSSIESVSINNDVRIAYDYETMLVTVQSDKPLTGLMVCDLQGRMVSSVRHLGNSLQLSLAGLPQGVYIVKAQGAGFGKSVKIIK